MRRFEQSGMSLIEMMVALAIVGLVLVVGLPAFMSSRQSSALRGAADNIASQVRMAREGAMSTGIARPLHFSEDSLGFDYHIHDANGAVTVGWSLPRGVHFRTAATQGLVMLPSGLASNSLNLVLTNETGRLDSVTVQISGFILVH